MRTMVLVYLPTFTYKTGSFMELNVGIHIPAPWFAYSEKKRVIIFRPGSRARSSESTSRAPAWRTSSMVDRISLGLPGGPGAA